MEPGLRVATAQLQNRQRMVGLQLLSLPQRDQAREVVGAPTAIDQRLTSAVAYAGRAESTALLEESETLDAELRQEEEAEAKAEAEKARPGLTMFTEGSRLDDGAAGYAVVWKNGQSLVGIKTHMDYNQEAYDAQCATLAGALESASRRQTTPEQATTPTDAQAAIKRIASEEPDPSQLYALQARKHIATLWRASPIIIEIRWCPAHKGAGATRRRTSGRKPRQNSQTPGGWNGRTARAGRRYAQCRSRDSSKTSSRRFRRKNR